MEEGKWPRTELDEHFLLSTGYLLALSREGTRGEPESKNWKTGPAPSYLFPVWPELLSNGPSPQQQQLVPTTLVPLSSFFPYPRASPHVPPQRYQHQLGSAPSAEVWVSSLGPLFKRLAVSTPTSFLCLLSPRGGSCLLHPCLNYFSISFLFPLFDSWD